MDSVSGSLEELDLGTFKFTGFTIEIYKNCGHNRGSTDGILHRALAGRPRPRHTLPRPQRLCRERWQEPARSREGRTDAGTRWQKQKSPAALLSPARCPGRLLHACPPPSPSQGAPSPHPPLTGAPGVRAPGLGFALQVCYSLVARNSLFVGHTHTQKIINFKVLRDSKGNPYASVLASVPSKECLFVFEMVGKEK